MIKLRRNPNNPSAVPSTVPVQVQDAPASEPSFDVETLLLKTGEILRREIINITSESAKGKLSPASARDLCSYIKLLNDLKTEQADELASMTDEELLARLTKE
jgi:hypothetical protein